MGPADALGYFQHRNCFRAGKGNTESGRRRKLSQIAFIIAMLVLSVAPRLPAQNSPKVNMVDPLTGKVNDSVTLTGQNLGKEAVSGVFLSDDKDDFKATLVEQDSAKIVLKVPQVKSGGYNISIQEGDKILILPLRFTVQG
jgi:IPT/TIG domain-containing protein